MIALGFLVYGLALGVLLGAVMVWDNRFSAGRRYAEECHEAYQRDLEAIDRIRKMNVVPLPCFSKGQAVDCPAPDYVGSDDHYRFHREILNVFEWLKREETADGR